MNPSAYLESVALCLGDMNDSVVFVGGMVRSLLVTDAGVPAVRPTIDVDVILEVHSRAEWANWEPRLRNAGFKPDLRDGAPICRYVASGSGADVTVDFLPLDEAVFGFSNRFYPSAYECARRHQIGCANVRIIDAVHFVATKLEAFGSHGNGDYFHHDLEDVVVIVDGRPEFKAELDSAPMLIRKFIVERMKQLFQDQAFHECLSGHLPPDFGSQARLPQLVQRLRKLAEYVE